MAGGDGPSAGAQQAFHKRSGSVGCDIIYFHRTPLLKGDDIKSELGEACGEE